MRDHSKHIEVNKYEAVKTIIENCSGKERKETISIKDALGRVLAEDVFAQWDSPNCLTCRMDSVAVHFDDFANGMPDTSKWVRGKDWEFANTGVAMPNGFDTAIVIEHVKLSDNDTKVAFDAMPTAKYSGTSSPGSKLRKGDLLIPKGTEITPLIQSTIASGKVLEVTVYRKPRVVFIPTGNELVPLSEEIPIGRNIESNSYMIAAKINAWGGIPIIYDIVPDNRQRLTDALIKAASEGDIVVLNAGSSKGNDDWGIEMLEENGTVFYHQTNHGPGHHSSFGVLNGTPVVGISGPPGGAAFTCDYYVYPAMMTFLGKEPHLKTISVRLGDEIPEADKFSRKPGGPKKSKGEERPSEGGEFYSVKQMELRVTEDGVIEAFAPSSSHPAPLEAEKAHAYYLMPSSNGMSVPHKGDIIKVELRP